MSNGDAHHDKTILVTGATGRQGGAVIRHLARDQWRLRALTRDPDTAPARALAERGVEVVGGDMSDRASLDAGRARTVHDPAPGVLHG